MHTGKQFTRPLPESRGRTLQTQRRGQLLIGKNRLAGRVKHQHNVGHGVRHDLQGIIAAQ